MGRSRTDRTTIGRDPLEAVIPAAEGKGEIPGEAPKRRAGRPRKIRGPAASAGLPSAEVSLHRPPDPAPAEFPKGRQKLTVHLGEDVVNRVKNAAYWNPRLTIARIAERGIRLALDQVERENGGPYPQRESELVGGRPIK
jgi:hypothetical protein